MRVAYTLPAALVAAFLLVSVAAAGPGATKQRMEIDLEFYPRHVFVFLPRQAGPLKSDSGSLPQIPDSQGRKVVRGGQEITIYTAIWTLKGKKGTLRISERNEWADVASDGNDDGIPDGVAFGTWKVVSGTGQYARVTGGGRSAHAGLGNDWNARYDGYLTKST